MKWISLKVKILVLTQPHSFKFRKSEDRDTKLEVKQMENYRKSVPKDYCGRGWMYIWGKRMLEKKVLMMIQKYG